MIVANQVVERSNKIYSSGLAPGTKEWGITKGERQSSSPWASPGSIPRA